MQHAVHALIGLREAKFFENVERDGTVRPDLRGVVFPLRSEIGFGENFKRSTARLFVGQRGDALFQFGKRGQSGKEPLLNKGRCFGMLRCCHRRKDYQSGRVKKSSAAPPGLGNYFDEQNPQLKLWAIVGRHSVTAKSVSVSLGLMQLVPPNLCFICG